MHDHTPILHFFVLSYRPGPKKDVSNSLIIVISISSIFILLFLSSFHKTMAISPSFDLQELINKNHHWAQIYGNSDAHLKSNYTDILAVNYISNGKSLNATFWLASGFKISSLSTYNQPGRKIVYGMLIDVDSNTKTGYNGADYDYYVESAAGKLSLCFPILRFLRSCHITFERSVSTYKYDVSYRRFCQPCCVQSIQ
jgi:hypothetical protein